jgi:RNA polymerase sigma-70 factor (ECF subfamily)
MAVKAELATSALDHDAVAGRELNREAGPPEQTSEEALATAGDAASFTLLYERYLDPVYRYVAARLATREEAEDVTSEAFRRAWSSLSGYRASGTFRAWVFRIVRRTLADHYRRAQPAARLARAVAELLRDEQPTPEERVERDERQRHARQLLARLTPELAG